MSRTTRTRAGGARRRATSGSVFIADQIERVNYKSLVPADYNPRTMDARSLRVLVGSLMRFGWVMPVVINRRTGNIVGGHQRARANAEVVRRLRRSKDRRASEFEKPPAIFVDVSLPVEKAMNVALNQISGDWDFFKKVAADQLRQNATYAQMRRQHLKLGRGWRSPLGIADFNLRDKQHRKEFRAAYGDHIIDFGAGGRQEAGWISKYLGVEAVPFEPFPRRGGKVSIKLARKLTDAFLGKLARGWRPDSVFCNFVLSSIGSAQDREKVLTVLAALGRHARQVVISVRSTEDVSYQVVLGKVNAKQGFLGIPDTTEPGLIVTAAGTARQKFQKFYMEDELRKVLQPYFGHLRRASLQERDTALVMVCRQPRSMPKAKLAEALRFEFDIKIDGEPTGRSEQAIAAFARYLQPAQRPAKRIA